MQISRPNMPSLNQNISSPSFGAIIVTVPNNEAIKIESEIDKTSSEFQNMFL